MKHKVRKGTQKGTIICIHGNSSSSKVFESVLHSDFIKQTKISIDLPGHSNNLDDYKNHQDFSISFFKNKLINFIDTIDDDILLIGNSLGGHLAIEIALEIKNLKGLVIFGTPPVKKPLNFEEAFLPVDALQTFFTEHPSNNNIESALNVAVQNKECIKILLSDFKNTNPLVRKNIAEDILNNNLIDEYKVFTDLNIPKFIIVGDKDPSVNRDYLKKVADDCNDNCELILFDNCGHYVSIEKPNYFNDSLNSIINKVFSV